jgi:hypothetical protein
MLVQGLPVNEVFPKEIGSGNDRQKIMPINAEDMDVVTHILIVVTDITTETTIIPQGPFMEML